MAKVHADYFGFGEGHQKDQQKGRTACTSATLAFMVLGLLSRGDLITTALFVAQWAIGDGAGKSTLTLSWGMTAAVIILGSAANGIAYWRYCTRFEKEYYPQYFSDAKPRSDDKEWKLQPGLWLSAERHREERIWGTVNAMWGTFLSLAFFLIVHMKYKATAFYMDVADHGGMLYFFASFAIVFGWIEIWAYSSHRFWHLKFIYQHFHKWHHRYQPPTPFSAVAFHPVEFAVYVCGGQLIFYVVPIHVMVAAIVGAYTAYYLIADHSGVKCVPIWPWQPTSQYHDDHHKYFHCNFGQHTTLFDRVFNTLRCADRKYGESVFGGQGSKGATKVA